MSAARGPRPAGLALRWGLALTAATAAAFLAALWAPSLLLSGAASCGVTGVEKTLCGLAAHGEAGILVGGDSRAKMQVDPRLLEERTGLSAVNIAEPLPLGGDLLTLRHVLARYPAALAGGPVVLVSISAASLDDLHLPDLTTAALLSWTPADHARVALRRPGAWFDLMARRWIRVAPKASLRMLGGGFDCTDGIRLPDYVREGKGYLPHYGSGGLRPLPGKPHAGYILDGAAWRGFRESLAWLAASPARAVVLYHAPIDPHWRRDPAHGEDMRREAAFTARIAAEAALHPKVRWLDLAAAPPPHLTPDLYTDSHHLNVRGAAVFTRHLADWLVAEGLAPGPEISSPGRGEEAP